MKKVNKEALKKVQSARSMLIMRHIFFGSLVLRLKLVEAPVGTMATDGKCIYYDPNFVIKYSQIILVGVLAHEAYHCIYKHHLRMVGKDPEDWNKAGDYRINWDLIQFGFKLPDFILIDAKYKDSTTEEIYHDLMKQKQEQQKQGSARQGQGQPQNGKGQGSNKPDKGNGKAEGGKGTGKAENGADKPDKGQGAANAEGQGDSFAEDFQDPGGMGGVIPPQNANEPAEVAKQDAEWTRVVQQAVNIARAHNAGTLPGHLERLVKEVLSPKVDWKSELRNLVSDSTQSDYDWNAPDRRFLHGSLVLPGLVPDGLSHIVVMVDTSGSIRQDILDQFAAEITAMLDENVVDKITIVYVDTKVQGTQVFERGEIVKLRPLGGGGTKFGSAIKHIDENYSDAKVLIAFTDLIVSDFGNEPSMPVIWAVHGTDAMFKTVKGRIPYGDVIHAA